MAQPQAVSASRRATKLGLGWGAAFISLLPLLVFVMDGGYQDGDWRLVIGALFTACLSLIGFLSARNVTQVVVDEYGLTFLPVGERVLFADLQSMNVPSWLDR